MSRLGRIVLTFITAVATVYFVFWVAGAVLFRLGGRGQATWFVSLTVAVVLSALAAGYVWKRSSNPGTAIGSVLTGAFTMGAIGFCVGFFGPILFTPGSNQGPLIGIFITGPLGFGLGAFGGWVKWAARRAREEETNH